MNHGVGESVILPVVPLEIGLRRKAYDAAALAYFAVLGTAPPVGFKNAINDMVVGLKGFSLWTKVAVLYVLGSHAEADYIYNLKNPTGTAITNTGTPTWTQYRGTKGNGTSSFHSTGINLNAMSPLAANDSSLFALYTETPSATATGPMLGDVSNQSFRLQQVSTTNWQYKLEQTLTVNPNNATPYNSSPHLIHATRGGETSSFAYYDGVQDETESAQASDGTVPAENLRIHFFGATFGTMRINICGAGNNFDATQAANFATVLLACDAALAAL